MTTTILLLSERSTRPPPPPKAPVCREVYIYYTPGYLLKQQSTTMNNNMTTLFGGVCVCVTGVLLARGRNQNTTTHNKSMDACHDDRKWTGRIMACGVKKTNLIYTNPHKCLYRWKTTSTSKLPYMSTKHRTHNKACMCSGTKDSRLGDG